MGTEKIAEKEAHKKIHNSQSSNLSLPHTIWVLLAAQKWSQTWEWGKV